MNLTLDQGKLAWKFNLKALADLIKEARLRAAITTHGASCERPCVFIYGQKSEFVKETDRDSIMRMCPDSSFHAIPDAGHYLHIEKQREFLQVLLAYVS